MTWFLFCCSSFHNEKMFEEKEKHFTLKENPKIKNKKERRKVKQQKIAHISLYRFISKIIWSVHILSSKKERCQTRTIVHVFIIFIIIFMCFFMPIHFIRTHAQTKQDFASDWYASICVRRCMLCGNRVSSLQIH